MIFIAFMGVAGLGMIFEAMEPRPPELWGHLRQSQEQQLTLGLSSLAGAAMMWLLRRRILPGAFGRPQTKNDE